MIKWMNSCTSKVTKVVLGVWVISVLTILTGIIIGL